MKNKKLLRNLFLIGIIIKFVDGIIELTGGIILFFIKSGSISKIIQSIFQHELVQDPTDLIANFIIKTSQNIPLKTISFIAIYLIIHGLIKIGLFFGLWHKKSWTHIAAGIVLSLFVIYQTIMLLSTHSIVLLIITLVDIFLLTLIGIEYKNKRSLIP